MVKCLSTKPETQVQSLGQEDLLEKEMATHSSILAWQIPWTEEHGGLQSTGLQRVGHDQRLHFHFCRWITLLPCELYWEFQFISMGCASCIYTFNFFLRCFVVFSLWLLPLLYKLIPNVCLFISLIQLWFEFLPLNIYILRFNFSFFATLHGIWDLSSQTRDITHSYSIRSSES